MTSGGKLLRYGYALPPGGKPRAVIVGLQGLSEFTEKYFETARTLLARDYGFFMMDWQGHGKSGRYLPNRDKRHSRGFQSDIDDLHAFVTEHVIPAADGAKLAMLGHSMGSNIGLRYLQQHPRVFSCAGFSAPLVEINALRSLPPLIRRIITGGFAAIASRSYVFGGTDWHTDIRGETGRALLSSDPVRNMVQDQWCLHDPDLRVGNVTFGWLREAEASCAALRRDSPPATPCLFALAGQEHLVDNGAARRLADRMPRVRLVDLPGARHEILMEKDNIRNVFFDAFFTLLHENT